MSSQPAILTIDDFHRSYGDEKPAFEYWQGEVSQKSQPTYLHGLIQSILSYFLQQAGWISPTEVRIRLGDARELVPDVIATKTPPTEPYPSPDDRVSALMKKAGKYLEWGVGAV